MADMMLTYWTGGFCRAINTTHNDSNQMTVKSVLL